MADARRVGRLARLERIREVERRRAAEQAASSGTAHDRLHTLAERSRDLARSYAERENMPDGAELAALLAFRRELSALSTRASSDAEIARVRAENARFALSSAQHRRDLVSQKLEVARRLATIERYDPASGNLARSLNRKKETASPTDRKPR